MQSLGDAKERSAKAKVAWEQFHQTYQAAHPNVPGLRFTDDFSLACALMSSSVDEVRQVTTIELTAEEKRKLDSLHREVTESEQSRRQAERTGGIINISSWPIMLEIQARGPERSWNWPMTSRS